MKKLITLSIALTLLFTPTIALAKGGHGGGHGGHGGHHGGSHTSHTSKSGSSKSGAKSGSKGSSSTVKSGNSGSKGSSSTVKSGNSGSKSSSHTSTHSVLHGGGKSAFARNAFRASSNGTPVSSWKSISSETKSFTDNTTNIPPLYRGGSVTNQLLFYSLYHPHHHYVPKDEKPEDLEKEDKEKSANKIAFIICGVIIIVIILAFVCVMFL